MDLAFQVPMQHCSLQHQTLLPSPVTSTTRHYFCFASVSSFFLELFLYSFPVAYGAPIDLRSSSFSVISCCLFILFMGFSRQEYWSGLPLPSPVDHVLSELSIMTHPSDHLTCLLRNLYAVKKEQLELDREQLTGSKLGKEYIKLYIFTLLI